MKYALVMVLLLVGLSGCDTKTTKDKLVGKWTEVNGKDTIEFTADGTFQGSMGYVAHKALTRIQGTYVMTDGDTVAINLSDGTSMVWKVKDGTDAAAVEFIYQHGGPKIDGSIAKFERAK